MKPICPLNAKFISGEDSSKRMFATSSLNQSGETTRIFGNVGRCFFSKLTFTVHNEVKAPTVCLYLRLLRYDSTSIQHCLINQLESIFQLNLSQPKGLIRGVWWEHLWFSTAIICLHKQPNF